MPRAALSIATILLAVAASPLASAAPAAAPQLTQAPATPQARALQRRVELEALTAEYESAVARFDANEAVLDRDRAGIAQRQGLLDLRKREYRDALSRCQDAACSDKLLPQRDAINADQLLLNQDVDSFNRRMEQRESDAARLDLMEAHMAEIREDLGKLEGPQPAAVR